MIEATILTHVAALLAGVVGCFAYLKHASGWQSPVQSELALIKHSLGLGPLAHAAHALPSVPTPSATAPPVPPPVGPVA